MPSVAKNLLEISPETARQISGRPECDSPVCGRLGMMLRSGGVAFDKVENGRPTTCTWTTPQGTYQGSGPTWHEALDAAAEDEAADQTL